MYLSVPSRSFGFEGVTLPCPNTLPTTFRLFEYSSYYGLMPDNLRRARGDIPVA